MKIKTFEENNNSWRIYNHTGCRKNRRLVENTSELKKQLRLDSFDFSQSAIEWDRNNRSKSHWHCMAWLADLEEVCCAWKKSSLQLRLTT